MTRTTSVALACLLAFSPCVSALAHDPTEMARAALEQKLEMPWVKENGFITDLGQALAKAKTDEKPVFAYFTVSYRADESCEALETGVLSSPEFKKFGEGVVLFLSIDSGLGDGSSGLLRTKGGLDVPYLVVLDAGGSVAAKAEKLDVKSFGAAVKAGGDFAKLKAKTEKSVDENLEVLARDMDLGNVPFQLAGGRVAALGKLTDDQQKRIDASTFRLQVWTAVSDADGSYDKRRAAGKLFAEMSAAGREPPSDELFQPFFILMLDEAEQTKDAKVFKKALEKLRSKFGDKPDEEWRDFFEEKAEKLEELETPAVEKKDGGDAK